MGLLSMLPMPWWRFGNLFAVASVRHRSSLTTELIENMDKKATWDRFYFEHSKKMPTSKHLEWFFGFESIRDYIMPLLHKSHSNSRFNVLDIGCGTSALGACIYRHSHIPVNVICADISPIAVRLMKENIRGNVIAPQNPNSHIEIVEQDCAELFGPYGSFSFDLILDKGTTDALLRSKEGKGKAVQLLKQCLKILQHSGSLLQFSDEDPDARLLWLETEAQEPGVMSAEVGVQEVGELRGVCYYAYQVTPRFV